MSKNKLNINMSKLPKDFDWKTYIRLNDDLKNINSKTESILHFLNNGIKEGRLYKIDYKKIPSDFDWKNYIILNDDLKHINNKIEAIIHYLKYGMNENRKYSKKNLINSFINNNKYYDFISEEQILYTKMFYKDNPLFLKYNIDRNILNIFDDIILLIDFNNGGGGTTFFVNSIVSKYKNFTTFLIIRFDNTKYILNINEEYLINIDIISLDDIKNLIDSIKKKISKIFINSFISYDSPFINYVMNLDILKIGITHDYYNIFENPQPTFKQIINSELECKINDKIDINKYDKLILQNIENVNIFSNYYKKNIDLVELPDYFKTNELTNTNNTKIHCCIIGNINEIKGADEFVKIFNYFEKKNSNIEFFLIGHLNNSYLKKCSNLKYNYYNNISEFNDLLIKFKPNLIIELTKWPETYSYTLTLSMLTDLPILYLKKNYDCVVTNRLKNYNKSFEFKSINELQNLINLQHQNYFYTISPIIGFNKYWNNLFIGDKIEKKTFTNFKFKYDIKPYFIYFPQFHDIHENNINFYQGFNDIKNLNLFNEKETIKKEIPLEEYCNINNYDYIKNNSLIQKQIDLIAEYNFSGIAMYYYWFSENSLSKKNMIMENVINKFFEPNLDLRNRKIFFIWANENWTNNVALSSNNNIIIKNTYNKINYIKNANNLIEYFKHDNYLKIENKPVFFIYHNYLIDNIDEFYLILNQKCIENNFHGVNLVLNSFENTINNYKKFYINFNYKKYDARFFDNKTKSIKLDYKKYIDDIYHIKNNKIQTIVYDFDNRPRLYKPLKLNMSTICINNNEMHKIVFSKKILQTYNNNNYNELDKILLVNALNEWGENMVFEPSDIYGYYNINLLKKSLI